MGRLIRIKTRDEALMTPGWVQRAAAGQSGKRLHDCRDFKPTWEIEEARREYQRDAAQASTPAAHSDGSAKAQQRASTVLACRAAVTREPLPAGHTQGILRREVNQDTLMRLRGKGMDVSVCNASPRKTVLGCPLFGGGFGIHTTAAAYNLLLSCSTRLGILPCSQDVSRQERVWW
ncbi:hypothetical protein ACKKBG_A11815 [Auxenochlorella protothecoides x Auxenochlorella symbiontica]